MPNYPKWLDELAGHAADPYKNVFIDNDMLTVSLCGRLFNGGEVRSENVHWFGKFETAIKKTECEGCKNEARNRIARGVAHRDYHAVGDAAALPESA